MQDILTGFRTNVMKIQNDIPFHPKERPHRPDAALVHCKSGGERGLKHFYSKVLCNFHVTDH